MVDGREFSGFMAKWYASLGKSCVEEGFAVRVELRLSVSCVELVLGEMCYHSR